MFGTSVPARTVAHCESDGDGSSNPGCKYYSKLGMCPPGPRLSHFMCVQKAIKLIA